jgi:hypothetical protein
MNPEANENINNPERESLDARHGNWVRRKVEAFVDAHPAAAQLLLAGTSAAAVIEHFSNDNRWSPDNPTLPLTLAVVLGSASLGRWLNERYKELDFSNKDWLKARFKALDIEEGE